MIVGFSLLAMGMGILMYAPLSSGMPVHSVQFRDGEEYVWIYRGGEDKERHPISEEQYRKREFYQNIIGPLLLVLSFLCIFAGVGWRTLVLLRSQCRTRSQAAEEENP